MFDTKLSAILSKGEGVKVALFDNYTKSIMSSFVSQSTFLESNFFLFHMLNDRRAQMDNLTAMVFIRQESVYDLVKELNEPSYGKYLIYFSNKIDEGIIEILARSDKYKVINEIYEMNMDIIRLDECLYKICGERSEENYNGERFGESYNGECYNGEIPDLNDKKPNNLAILSGLHTILSTLGVSPRIILHESVYNRKKRNKFLPKGQETNWQNRKDSLNENFDSNRKSDPNKNYNNTNENHQRNLIQKLNTSTEKYFKQGTLVFLSRRFDSITPLLYDWRYQGMITEYFDFLAPGIIKIDKICCFTDDFFFMNKFFDINKVSINLKKFVNDQNNEVNLENMKRKESAEMHLKIHNFIVKKCIENKEFSELEIKILKGNVSVKSLFEEIDKIVSTNRKEEASSNKTDEFMSKSDEKFSQTEVKVQKTILIYLLKNPTKITRPEFAKYKNLIKYVKENQAQNLKLEFKDRLDMKLSYDPPIKRILMKVIKNKLEKQFKSFRSQEFSKDEPLIICIDEITMNEYRAIDALMIEQGIENYHVLCEKVITWKDVMGKLV